MQNSIPQAINADGSKRNKNDPYDYGLNEYDAESEYHVWLEELRDASNYTPKRKLKRSRNLV